MMEYKKNVQNLKWHAILNYFCTNAVRSFRFALYDLKMKNASLVGNAVKTNNKTKCTNPTQISMQYEITGSTKEMS